MKVAVLLSGQPRFINLSCRFLKEEFSYPDIEFDIFCHYWGDVSFSKKSEGKYIDFREQIKNANQILEPKTCLVEGFDDLDKFITHIETILVTISKNKYKQYNNPPKIKRYKWGQHLSLLKAYNLLEKYEEKNKIKYDVVIKGRTDFVYKNKICYNSEKEYLNYKFLNYLNFTSLKEPQSITTGCQYQQYSPIQQDPKNSSWKNVGKADTFFYPTETWKRDERNIFRTGDISLCANRLAAKNYFGEYLATYLNTYTKSYFNQNDIFVRHDAVQGDIAINNNIRVFRLKKCRFHRLVNEYDFKNGWENVEKNKTILIRDIYNTDINYIQEQLIKFANKKGEPAPY